MYPYPKNAVDSQKLTNPECRAPCLPVDPNCGLVIFALCESSASAQSCTPAQSGSSRSWDSSAVVPRRASELIRRPVPWVCGNSVTVFSFHPGSWRSSVKRRTGGVAKCRPLGDAEFGASILRIACSGECLEVARLTCGCSGDGVFVTPPGIRNDALRPLNQGREPDTGSRPTAMVARTECVPHRHLIKKLTGRCGGK